MVQATTPTFILTLPNDVDLNQATRVIFTLKQRSTVLTKSNTELDINHNVITVYLSQADTVNIYEGEAEIQLNWTYSNGARACSNIVSVHISPNLLPEVIS